MNDAEPTPELEVAIEVSEVVEVTPTCWRCNATLRVNVRFCGSCGLPAKVDDFLEAPPSRPRIGLGMALFTYFAMLAVVLVVWLVGFESVRSTLLVDVGVIAFGVIVFISYWRELGALLGPPRGLDATRIAMAIGVVLMLFGVMQLVVAAFPAAFPSMMDSYRVEGVGLFFAVVQIGPLTALGEELLFRGIILRGLRNTFPDRTAIIVAAAMFATIHRSPLNYFHTGVLGALCGWLTVRSGSVWPAVLVHTAWNTTMVLLDA